MAPPKKGQKMSLGDFLGDESLGSWADEMEDMPAVADLKCKAPGSYSSGYARREYGDASSSGRDFGGFSRNDREERYQQLPIPDKPPYTAHVGNLSFDVSDDKISDFFLQCDVSNVRLPRDKLEDRPKGFGYVEFNTKEGLIAAMELNGAQLSGRPVRVSVAVPPKDHGEERTLGEWRRAGPLPPLESQGGRRGSERSDRDRESGDRGDRRHSAFEGSDKLRNLDKWERTGPLPPSIPTASEHSRPRSGDRSERGEPREFRRRSPAPGAEGGKGGYRERQVVERPPTAPERDNEWRRGARPDPPIPQRTPTAPSSPVAATTRPRLELKKRSEHPVEPALASATSDSSSRPNPFGAAKPIDTFQREKEVEEKRLAAIAAKKVKEEKERKARAATVGETDKGEAGAPAVNKDFTLLRRASGADGGTAAEGDGGQETIPTAPKRREEAKSTRTTPSNWRKSEPKETTPTEEATDGWSTVSSKKIRAANGARS